MSQKVTEMTKSQCEMIALIDIINIIDDRAETESAVEVCEMLAAIAEKLGQIRQDMAEKIAATSFVDGKITSDSRREETKRLAEIPMTRLVKYV